MQKQHDTAETKESSLLIVVAARLLQSKNSDYDEMVMFIFWNPSLNFV